MATYLARSGAWTEIDFCYDFKTQYPGYSNGCEHAWPVRIESGDYWGWAASWAFMYVPPAGNTQRAMAFDEGKFWCGNLWSYIGGGSGYATFVGTRTSTKTEFTVPDITHYAVTYRDESGVPYWLGSAGQGGYFGISRGPDNDASELVETDNGYYRIYNGYQDSVQGSIPFTTDSNCFIRAQTWITAAKSWSGSSTINHFGKTKAEKIAALPGLAEVYITSIGHIKDSCITSGHIDFPGMDMNNSLYWRYNWQEDYFTPYKGVLKRYYRIDETGAAIEFKSEVRDDPAVENKFILDGSCFRRGYDSEFPQLCSGEIRSSTIYWMDYINQFPTEVDDLTVTNFFGSFRSTYLYQPYDTKMSNHKGIVAYEQSWITTPSYGRMDLVLHNFTTQECDLGIRIQMRGNYDYNTWLELQITHCVFPAAMTLLVTTGMDELVNGAYFARDPNEVLPGAGLESGWYETYPLYMTIHGETFEIGVNTATQSWSGSTCTYTGVQATTNEVALDMSKYGIPTNKMEHALLASTTGDTDLSTNIIGDIDHSKLFSNPASNRELKNSASKFKYNAADPDEVPGPVCTQ